MKAVYVTAGFAAVGLGVWVCIILINAMRKRIAIVIGRMQERLRRQRERKTNGY